jgi:hypothetical protein
MNFKIISFIIVFLFKVNAIANYVFNFNSENCLKAQVHLLDLKMEKARFYLSNEKKLNKQNASTILIENYIEYLEIFITEEKELFDNFKKNEKKRCKELDLLSSEDPYYLLSKAEIKLQWGILKLKFEDYFGASMSIRDAYILLLKNNKKYPGFVPNLKTLGWTESLASTVPSKFNWMVNMLGIKGDYAQGIKKLETFIALNDSATPNFLYLEATYSLAYIYNHIAKDKVKALEVGGRHLLPERNTLSRFMLATLYNTCGENEKMLKVALGHRTHKEALPIYHLDYLTGIGLLRKQKQGSELFLKNFLQNFRGINGLSSASFALAQYYKLEGDGIKSDYYLSQTHKKFKPGNEQDKQAFKESLLGITDNLDLLKARLLFDGGYFNQAQIAILKAEKNSTSRKDEKTEIYYRKARIYHALQDNEQAITYYLKTIELGRESDRYFAANAALQLGVVYEEKGYLETSKAYFYDVLNGFPKNN